MFLYQMKREDPNCINDKPSMKVRDSARGRAGSIRREWLFPSRGKTGVENQDLEEGNKLTSRFRGWVVEQSYIPPHATGG